MTIQELEAVVKELRGIRLSLHTCPNPYYGQEHWTRWTFEAVLESGRKYLYGDRVSPEEMRRRHTAVVKWMRPILQWVRDHPDQEVFFTVTFGRDWNRRLEYEIRARNGFVEIALPHQDAGGERHWITKDLKRKYLVNVD